MVPRLHYLELREQMLPYAEDTPSAITTPIISAYFLLLGIPWKLLQGFIIK